MMSTRATYLLAVVGLLAATTAQGATLPLGSWQLVTNPTNYTGGSGTTITPGVDTSSFTLSNTDAGFTTGTGFFTTFDPYTLGDTFGVGEKIRLSFDMTIDASDSYSNNSFRFGLYNHNGNAPETDALNWLGYMVHAASPSGSQGEIMSRSTANANPYASGSGADSLPRNTTVGPTDSLRGGNYSVLMELTLASATEVGLAVSIIGEDTDQNPYEWATSIQDLHEFQPGQTTFDRLGFQLTGAAGGVTDSIAFSNVTISVVPEPSSVALALGALAGMALVVQRKRSALRVGS